MKYTHIPVIVCCCLYLNMPAQNSYGLVIGINNYFKLENGKQVPDTENSKLKGCVQDARAIKLLLTDRFGFDPGQIRELYDYQATADNIRQEIKLMLARSKKGDVAVFYFSGHGFSFPHIDPETGTQWEEALCTADFSATRPYNYIQGTEMAYWFGQFVDKGVTMTALFDCCHSNSTVRLQKYNRSLTGIRKVLDMNAWVQAPEPSVAMSEMISFPVKKPLLAREAFPQTVSCDGKGNVEDLNAWLQAHGGAIAEAATNCPGTLNWSYDLIGKFRLSCTETRLVYQFRVRDACGTADTTQASFSIEDLDPPLLLSPASDTTIACCGQNYRPAFEGWLDRNAGAKASDACSLSWSNSATKKMKQTLNDLEATGQATVTFTATDGCNPVMTAATFFVEDQAEQEANRVSELEFKLILDLLNHFGELDRQLSDFVIGDRSVYIPGRMPFIREQLDLIDRQRIELMPVTTDDNGIPLFRADAPIPKSTLEAIQGTPRMGKLVRSIDSLLVLVDPLFVDREYPWSTAPKPVIQLPLDFLLPVSDATNYEAYLDQTGEDLPKELVLVTADPAQFPYRPFPFRPPSKIPGSNFLFMSATDDVQKGVEKKDENKKPRGAFTKALITVLRDGPASQSAVTVYQKVKQQMADRYIPHTPSMSIAENRSKQNLFGVNSKKLTAAFAATCIRVNPDKTLVLNKGFVSGLSAGNILSYQERDKRIDIVVVSVSETESTARIKPDFRPQNFSVPALLDNDTSLVNKKFILSDNYTSSLPLVSVYIPKYPCTAAQQAAILEQYYKPLMLQDPDLIPVDSFSDHCTKVFLQTKQFTQVQLGKETPPQSLEKLSAAVQPLNDYFIYLPVRNDISEAVREYCQKDQNFALVADAGAAKLSFYCTYSRKINDLVYVVTDQETTGKKRFSPRRPAPYYYFPATDPKTLKPLTAQQVANQIYQTMLLFASRYGWLNKSPKK